MASSNKSRRMVSTFKTTRLRLALSAVAAAAIAFGALQANARLDAPTSYAIKDAQIITGNGKTLAKGTVVFRDGLITAVGENVKVPADARVIDGTGMTVYPGLIDGFTNLGLPAPAQPQPQQGQGGGRQAALAAAAAGQQPNPDQAHGDPSLSAADQVKPGGTAVEDARSAGITSALTSPRQGLFAGQSAFINLGGNESSRMVLRAPVALTIQFTTGAGFFGQYPNSLMGTVAFIRQSFYDAIHYRDEVDRFNKVKRGIDRPEYDKKLAALQPALRGEMPVLFVANSEGDIRRSLMIADEFKLRPIIEGALYGYRMAGVLKSKNVPVILSLDFPRRPSDLSDEDDEPIRVLRARAEIPKGAGVLAQAGVKFAFTSGQLRPSDFLGNAQRAVENGLPKEEALRALSINAAEIFGLSDQVGTIEVGKIANLVVTNGDLLARDMKIRHVFIDGSEIELKKPEPAPQRGFGGPRGAGAGAAGPAGVNPAGEWSLVLRMPQGEVNARLSLRKEGDQILGTLSAPQGTSEIRNARMNGNSLSFSYSLPINTDTVEFAVTGTIEGDTMRGVVLIPSIGSIELTGTRPR